MVVGGSDLERAKVFRFDYSKRICLFASRKEGPVATGMQATLLNNGGQQGFGRCSIASQGSLEDDECDSSEELIGSASGGGQSESLTVGLQPKLAPIDQWLHGAYHRFQALLSRLG